MTNLYKDENPKLKKYLEDINKIRKISYIFDKNRKENKIDNFSESDFWYSLLLISRNYINDNFHKMLDMVNKEYIEKAFQCKLEPEDYLDKVFLFDNDEILYKLLNKQWFYCNSQKDSKRMFIKLRNHLSHYNYEYRNDYIIEINDEGFIMELSVATLVLILLAALSNLGQSKRIGSYEQCVLGIMGEKFDITVTNKIDYNYLTPLEYVHESLDSEITLIKNVAISEAKYKGIPELFQPYYIKNTILKELPCQYNEFGYEIKIESLEEPAKEKLDKYISKNNYSLDNYTWNNIYQMIKNDIKKATILYKNTIDILYRVLTKKEYYNDYMVYMPLLNNESIISYLNVVFCDFAIECNTNMKDTLFDYVEPFDIKNIPRKIRNSITHCHYKFEDITNDSDDIIIEFWDEKDNKINFECQIKRCNINKLVDEYINNF